MADGRYLDEFQHGIKQGEHKLVFAGVIAVQTLPEDNWVQECFPRPIWSGRAALFPALRFLTRAHAQREEREMMEKLERQQKGEKAPAKEKEEKLGYIVFFLKNTTPDIGSWRGSKDRLSCCL